jgi:hypothetical protein
MCSLTRPMRPSVWVISPISKRDLPWLGITLVNRHAVRRHIKGHIQHVKEVVGEIFFDNVALVTAADHKIRDAMRSVGLHDVP